MPGVSTATMPGFLSCTVPRFEEGKGDLWCAVAKLSDYQVMPGKVSADQGLCTVTKDTVIGRGQVYACQIFQYLDVDAAS